jgi:cell wall-associated NlpC family hydrolase
MTPKNTQAEALSQVPESLQTPSGFHEVLAGASTKQLEYAQNIVALWTKISLAEARESEFTGNEKRARRFEINALKRDKNRLARAQMLTADNQMIPDGPLKKKAKEVLSNSSIDQVSAGNLIQLERAERWTLSKLYAYKRTLDKDWLPTEIPLDSKNIIEGDEIIIDFGKNISANAKIGAADILPPSIQIVKIFDRDMGVRVGRRDIVGGRAGYYDANNKYIPIYSGYTLQIPTAVELANPDYKGFGIKNSIEQDPAKIALLNTQDATALEYFAGILEKSRGEDRIDGMYQLIANEAWSAGTYGERLTRMIEIAKKYLTTLPTESVDEMKSLISRLEKTKEIVGNKDFKLDFDRYKTAIAKHESGGQAYLARNDSAGKSRGVRPGVWAFGKYQFTVETLRGYGVDLGNPPEESKIQSWLGNASLQEEIMDRYMIKNLEQHILGNDRIMKDMVTDGTSISYYLALTHIGGPGALSGNKLKQDWLGTSTHAYAMGVAGVYERSASAGDIATAVVREEALPGAAIDRETLIGGAESHLWKPYKLWANGDRAIDCSQLIVESLKQARVVNSRFDTNAANLRALSSGKPASSVERGDLVFLRKEGRISHVAIALGPVTNGGIPILDASTNTGKVAKRNQPITGEVEVGVPKFYS